MKTAMVKKHQIGLFLFSGANFVRIKKSTKLGLSMNPVEEDFDYIADESPTTELTQYKPTIDQDLTMYKGEPDYEMIWPYFYEMKTGSDAHTECMVVFMQQPVDASGKDISLDSATDDAGYRAWLTDSVISVQDLTAEDKKLNFKVMFGGTIKKGIATMIDGEPVFKEGTISSTTSTSTPTVTDTEKENS